MERRPGTPEDSRDLVRTLACVLQKLVDVNRKVSHPPMLNSRHAFHARSHRTG
jgi:hypothetical protein